MKKSILLIVLIIVVGAGAFFGGIKYQQSQQSNSRQFGANLQNAGRIGSGQNGTRMRTGGGQVMGEILSQDDKSITVKLQDGSSKIIILSDKTTINKATVGSKLDLTTGVRVGVFGSQNTDGSVTAQMIQLNPTFRGPTGGVSNRQN